MNLRDLREFAEKVAGELSHAIASNNGKCPVIEGALCKAMVVCCEVIELQGCDGEPNGKIAADNDEDDLADAVDLSESIDLSYLLDDDIGPVSLSSDRWVIVDRGAAADAPVGNVRIAE